MSKQRNRRIDDFFRAPVLGGEKVQRAYNYFYIDWSVRPYAATWMHEQPVPVDFATDVVWKGGVDKVITVCCVFGQQQEEQDEKQQKPALYKDATMVALLKSNLQKCVRRQLTQRALQTARYLMDLDEVTLLVRRLTIIALEDVVLHESITVLVWLTAVMSRKTFTVTRHIKEWLLGLVKVLCDENQEHYWAHGIGGGGLGDDANASTLKQSCQHWSAANVDEHRRSVALSLLFRVSYGGLPGDCAMLIKFASRLSEGVMTISNTPVEGLGLETVDRLNLSRIELASADFHCIPALPQMLVRKYPKFTKQQITKAVWHYRSKINDRVTTAYTQQEKDEKAQLHVCFVTIRQYLEYVQKRQIEMCANTAAYRQHVNDVRTVRYGDG
jgi:hypothetical protein